VFYFGAYEPDYLAFFLGKLHPGDTVFDLGANIGVYTVPSAITVGPRGHIYSFEAHPGIAERLRRNLALNGLANVTVIARAVGLGFCDRNLHIAPDHGQNSLMSLGDEVGVFPVATTELDTFVHENAVGAVHAIKIDIEGAEVEALKGACATLRRDRPLIMAEVNSDRLTAAGESPRTLIEYLRNLGYEVQALDGNRTYPITDARLDQEANWTVLAT
jgi:FkbM family methyltransferase